MWDTLVEISTYKSKLTVHVAQMNRKIISLIRRLKLKKYFHQQHVDIYNRISILFRRTLIRLKRRYE
jgi:hypothetical protein